MNPVKDIKYFSLDLELNNLNNGQTPKIIQVGIAIASPIRPNDIQTFSWYLDPEEEISPFITKLTGIDNQLVKEKAVSHETVAEQFGELLKVNECFVNPIVWGGGGDGNDASELKAEFRERNIDFPFFGRRVVDIKTLYVFKQMVEGKSPSGGLRKSMNSCGLSFKGTPHNAEFDSLNTLRFFFYFLQRQRKFEEFRNDVRTMK
jgi:inhibitor of KinA sporulation pathway (predicted exonuclease)